MNMNYYYAVFQFVKTTNSKVVYKHTNGDLKALVDKNSHPFKFLQIEKKLGKIWICTFWKEITADEYEFFIYN